MTGKILVVFLCLLATLFSVGAASHTGLMTWMSLAASSTAFVAMALNQFLATRPRFLEPLFGGLDRIYHFHRQIGIAALVLILIHYFVTPDFQGKQLTAGLNLLAKEAGKYGFYGLIALIALSLVKRIPYTKFEVPYGLWRQSHRLMGVFFLFIAFHQFFIKRPFDGTALLANYLNLFAVIGVGSFAYTQLMAFLKRRSYTVTSVEKHAAATIIEAKPNRGPIKARPGQFAFLHFSKAGLREPHPFTIAGLGKDGSVRFAIKPLGDYTARLREEAAVGDRILVEGGYGRFVHTRGGDKQIWLAGGIGITPFLAMAESLLPEEKRKIHLVHCVRDGAEAVRADMLAEASGRVPGFSFHLHDSATAGRIDAEKLQASVPFEVDGSELWFCGPPPLRNAIVSGLKKAGRKLGKIEFERFEFR
ncbi:MAG: ferric reductase-like transmembrane domain-containing protein [Nitratireductor sp.]|nr:ferric reductase-like transmembrane domain-containing protein [Nitratireductor sp.]